MQLDRYIEGVHEQVMVAAEASGDDVKRLAERLTAPLDSSLRLMLLEALADAASEITLELAPGSVEVRLRGRDPELVVTPPPAAPSMPPPTPDDVMMPSPEFDDGGTARITLRLPETLKQRIEESAARQAVSVNAWLVRAVTAAVEPRREHDAGPAGTPSGTSRFTGWVR